jgi:hypothetical protein
MADGPIEPKILQSAVLLGVIPLAAVTNFQLKEGYKVAQVAGSSTFSQMIAPTTKTITIDALLIGAQRSFRPLLEALALTNRFLAAAVSPLLQITGIPVVARLGVHLDMQITDLTFTQDNTNRDTIKVSISLTHVPRSTEVEAFGFGADLALGALGGLIP